MGEGLKRAAAAARETMTPAERRRADEDEAAKTTRCPFCRARAGQWCTTWGRYSGGSRRAARIHQARMNAWRGARESTEE